jgi:hypothetical protein
MNWAVNAAAWWQHNHAATEPRSWLEYVIVGIAAVVMAWTLVKATQWTIRPGEHNADHIKRTILDDEFIEEPRAKK